MTLSVRPDPRLPSQASADATYCDAGALGSPAQQTNQKIFGGAPDSTLRRSLIITVKDMAVMLHRDLPRAVEIIRRRTPYVDGDQRAALEQYLNLLATPQIVAMIQIACTENLTNIITVNPLPDNPVLRSAALLTGLVEALARLGYDRVSTRHLNIDTSDPDIVIRAIVAELELLLATLARLNR